MYAQPREWFSIKNVPEEEHNFFLNQSLKEDCLIIINRLLKEDAKGIFANAVDVSKFPNYLRFIEKPMDLGLLKKNLISGVYKDTTDFSNDCRQIWLNCETFNTPGDPFSTSANHCSTVFEELWAHFLKKLDVLVKHDEEKKFGFDKIVGKPTEQRKKNFNSSKFSENTQIKNQPQSEGEPKENQVDEKKKRQLELAAQRERAILKAKVEAMKQKQLKSSKGSDGKESDEKEGKSDEKELDDDGSRLKETGKKLDDDKELETIKHSTDGATDAKEQKTVPLKVSNDDDSREKTKVLKSEGSVKNNGDEDLSDEELEKELKRAMGEESSSATEIDSD